jgi:D-alanine-D-alanine ligase-like ATP-grasp enzyme
MEISRVALLTAQKLSGSKYYKNQLIYGFDMGLDRNGRVWVIEANLKPMLSHFRKLADKSMYRRILEYKKG